MGITQYHKKEQNMTQLGTVVRSEKSQNNEKSSLPEVKEPNATESCRHDADKPVLGAEETTGSRDVVTREPKEVKDEEVLATEVQQVLAAEDQVLPAEDQVLAAEDQVLAAEVHVLAAEDQVLSTEVQQVLETEEAAQVQVLAGEDDDQVLAAEDDVQVLAADEASQVLVAGDPAQFSSGEHNC